VTETLSVEDRILIAIAAQSDALWLPERHRGNVSHGALYEFRRDFVASGISWNSGLAGDVDNASFRQKAARSLDVLKGNGLITIPPTGDVKTKFIKLTEAGDNLARNLIGLSSFEFVVTRLDQMARIERDGQCYWANGFWHHAHRNEQKHFEAGWCGELELAGIDKPAGGSWTAEEWKKATPRIWDFQIDFAVLMSRGYAITNTYSGSSVFYALSPSGVALAKKRLKAGCPDEAPEPVDNPEVL
jgi:hypothetical protein